MCRLQFSEEDPDDDAAARPPVPRQVRGLGTDIGLVGSALFVAQLLLSAAMGSVVKATGTTAVVMATAAVLSAAGALSATRVVYLDL